MNGVCAFIGDTSSCKTAWTVYKITCKTYGCNCFYIGNSQWYIKKQVQEHIGEAARLYRKLILPTNQSQQTTHRSSSQSQISTTILVKFSLDTLTNSVRKSQPLCIITNQPWEAPTRTLRRTNSDASSFTADCENEPPSNLTSYLPPVVDFSPIKAHPHPPNPRQENCSDSVLACHLLSHLLHFCFNSRLEVREWCCSHISVNIHWKPNTISLMNTTCT